MKKGLFLIMLTIISCGLFFTGCGKGEILNKKPVLQVKTLAGNKVLNENVQDILEDFTANIDRDIYTIPYKLYTTDNVFSPQTDEFVVENKGIYNQDGKQLFANTDNLKAKSVFTYDLAIVKDMKLKKYGLINRKGEIALPCEYSFIGKFEDRLAVIRNEHGYGFVNHKGKVVLEPRLTFALPFSEDLSACEENGKFGFMRVDGTWAIEPKYQEAGSFNDGIAPVKLDGKIGYIDYHGETVIPFIYDKATTFLNKMALVSKNNYSMLINNKNTVLSKAKLRGDFLKAFDQLSIPVRNYLVNIRVGGVIDNNGNLPIEFGTSRKDGQALIETGEHFPLGLNLIDPIMVISPNKVGYADLDTGNWLIPAKKITATPFLGGYAITFDGEEVKIIDNLGNEVKNPIIKIDDKEYTDYMVFVNQTDDEGEEEETNENEPLGNMPFIFNITIHDNNGKLPNVVFNSSVSKLRNGAYLTNIKLLDENNDTSSLIEHPCLVKFIR